ncbi:hypothetical protein SSU93_13660 [Enterococcus avium]|uniref:hypothetical protein n=1 Tax=Enterococcus avium TaxID=33945 RepID=UPI002A9181CB|nr:hypothetical protein [Enterococcus avium]MDY6442090.1 hypothetical protein [Enterococcus avium]MDY6447860.1 hypothetical protein [Enterococcus avium]MDY6454318.1 hypothetical protein [Enterococcus avium]MDY6474451.1 hypothetical protein [Enterococcus avium]
MVKDIQAVHYNRNQSPKTTIKQFGHEQTEEIWDFHKSIPEYEKTPLIKLRDLAKYLGVKEVYIKDESARFDLNAFKVLGGSYCLSSKNSANRQNNGIYAKK